MAITDGLVCCWDLDEVNGQRFDHVGGVTLSEYGAVASAPGRVRSAAAFTGGNYLYHLGGAQPSFVPPFTVAFWLWLDAAPAGKSLTCVCRGNNLFGGYFFYFVVLDPVVGTGGLLEMSIGEGGVRGLVRATVPLSLGAWHLVVGWATSTTPGDGGTTHIQIDNGPIYTAGSGLSQTGQNPGLSVGATMSGASTLQGKMDQLAYWNRPLTSQDERDILWNDGAGIDCTFTVLAAVCEPLPQWIAYGATGGPEWGTALFAAPGGWEQRAQMFAQVRGRWDVSFINVSKAQATTLVDFFRAVAWGKAGSFCFMDWRDHSFANVIGTGNGTTSTFQVVKVYTSGTLSYARPLTRPIVSSLVVTVNGVETSAYTVDAVSGRLLFSAPPANGAVIHASGDFEVLVRFESDQLMVTCVTPEVFSCTGLGLVELIGE